MASRPDSRLELEPFRELEPPRELELDPELRLDPEPEPPLELDPELRLDPEPLPELDRELDPELLEPELRRELELELAAALRRELEPELRLEPEVLFDFEPPFALEPLLELEPRFALEPLFDFEPPLELEPDPPLEPEPRLLSSSSAKIKLLRLVCRGPRLADRQPLHQPLLLELALLRRDPTVVRVHLQLKQVTPDGRRIVELAVRLVGDLLHDPGNATHGRQGKQQKLLEQTHQAAPASSTNE